MNVFSFGGRQKRELITILNIIFYLLLIYIFLSIIMSITIFI